MKSLLVIAVFLFSVNALTAQSAACNVLPDSLKGNYEGDCKNGKAEGMGKATGTDRYEGNFKNGLPDGTGTYTWKNGDWYTGSWKKGLMEGKGELFSKAKNSSITGFWKKNVYKGEYEKPYEVFNESSTMRHQDFNNIDKKGNSVTVSIESGMASNVANVDDFQIMFGSYDRFNKKDQMIKTKVIEFQNVRFPFRIKFNMGGSPFDFEIYESGQWLVNVLLL
jgi:hypothetical protein